MNEFLHLPPQYMPTAKLRIIHLWEAGELRRIKRVKQWQQLWIDPLEEGHGVWVDVERDEIENVIEPAKDIGTDTSNTYCDYDEYR
jgi:hypothetical protein